MTLWQFQSKTSERVIRYSETKSHYDEKKYRLHAKPSIVQGASHRSACVSMGIKTLLDS